MRKSYLIIGLIVFCCVICLCLSVFLFYFFSPSGGSIHQSTDTSIIVTYDSVGECSFATNTLCIDDGTSIYPTDEALVGRDMMIRGTVTEVDNTALAFDGPLMISVATEFGTSLKINSPSGFDVCGFSQESRDTAFSLVAGDKVELLGTVNEDGAITMCDTAHYIKKIN